MLRITVLAALVALVNAWTARHFGTGLTDFLLTNAFVVALLWVLGHVSERDRSRFEGLIGRLFAGILQWPVLAMLALVFVAATSFVSSVTVLSGGVAGTVPIRLIPQSGADRLPFAETADVRLDGPDDFVRVVCITSPFGRRFRLDAEGFVPLYLDVPPWAGATVNLASDLQRVPSVVVRVPGAAQSFVEKGSFEVVLNEGEPVVVPGAADRGALWIGPARKVPPEVLEARRGEIQLAAPAIRALADQIYYRWLGAIESGISVRPGDRLRVRLLSLGGQVKAEAEFTVGQDAFQDVSLD